MKRVLRLMLLILFSKGVYTQSPLEFNEEEVYDVVFTELEGASLSPENHYLTYSIPLLLMEQVANIRNHRFSEEEKELLRKKVIRDKLTDQYKKLKTREAERDDLLFTAANTGAWEDSLKKVKEDIEEIKKEILYLKSGPRVIVPDTISLNIKQTPQKASLFEGSRFSPYQYSRKNNFDLLVSGVIEEIGGYLYIELKVFDLLREKETWSYSNITGGVDVYTDLNEPVRALQGMLLGREWGSVIISSDQPDCRIYVNGSFSGFGSAFLPFAEPGEMVVQCQYYNLFREEQTFSLEPGEEKRVEFVTDEVKPLLLDLDTVPPGADIYVRSRWVGQTPFQMEVFPGDREAIILKEGFYQYNLPLDREPGEISLDLVPREIDLIAAREKSRRDFYQALGFWLFTLPLPIISWEGAVDYKNAYDSSTGMSWEVRSRLKSYEEGFYQGYVWSLGINIGLALNMVVQWGRYLQATDDLQ